MKQIPNNLNDLKEQIRKQVESPTQLKVYRRQLKALTAYQAIYNGTQGDEADKHYLAFRIVDDFFYCGDFYEFANFDHDQLNMVKTMLEYSLQEKYTGKYAKSVKLLPSILQLSKFGYRHIKTRQLEYLANGLEVDTFTVYYLERLHNVITPKGYLTPQEIARQIKITWQVIIEYLRTYTE